MVASALLCMGETSTTKPAAATTASAPAPTAPDKMPAATRRSTWGWAPSGEGRPPSTIAVAQPAAAPSTSPSVP